MKNTIKTLHRIFQPEFGRLIYDLLNETNEIDSIIFNLNGKIIAVDRENTVKGNQTHFNFKEANQIAASLNKRLFTKEEFEELMKFPHEVIRKKNDIVLQIEITDIYGKLQTLEFPAAGYRIANGVYGFRGSYGTYWSITPNGNFGYGLYFSSTNVYPQYYNSRAYGYSVRCVKDVEIKLK